MNKYIGREYKIRQAANGYTVTRNDIKYASTEEEKYDTSYIFSIIQDVVEFLYLRFGEKHGPAQLVDFEITEAAGTFSPNKMAEIRDLNRDLNDA